MTKQEVRDLLAKVLRPEEMSIDPPTPKEWQGLEERLGTRFPTELVHFIELMSEFSFPGHILNVTQAGRTNGNDEIEVIYADERRNFEWPEALIPFYGIGNGDYFALNRNEGMGSAVYYGFHEDGHVDKQCDSFAAWLEGLPAFLHGHR